MIYLSLVTRTMVQIDPSLRYKVCITGTLCKQETNKLSHAQLCKCLCLNVSLCSSSSHFFPPFFRLTFSFSFFYPPPPPPPPFFSFLLSGAGRAAVVNVSAGCLTIATICKALRRPPTPQYLPTTLLLSCHRFFLQVTGQRACTPHPGTNQSFKLESYKDFDHLNSPPLPHLPSTFYPLPLAFSSNCPTR